MPGDTFGLEVNDFYRVMVRIFTSKGKDSIRNASLAPDSPNKGAVETSSNASTPKRAEHMVSVIGCDDKMSSNGVEDVAM